MLSSYLLIFCEIVVGLVFALSSAAKIRRFQPFVTTVRDFQILPPPIVPLVALGLLIGELSVVLLLCIWPGAALVLAAGLLLLFSIALASVLKRGIRTPCGCFGSRQPIVSRIDFARTCNFLLCAFGGSWLEARVGAVAHYTPWHLGFLGLAALIYVMIWTHVYEVHHLLVAK